MTRDQIMQNFYNNQLIAQQNTQNTMLLQQQNSSPFINKTSAEEFKKKSLETVIENIDIDDNNEVNSNKKNENINNINEDIEMSNATNMQLKPSDKNNSLEKLIEEQTDTDIPLYQPEEQENK